MEQMILIDYRKCTGCRLCETVCSVANTLSCNPERSRIRILRREWEGIQVPSLCQQCDDPACAAICPVHALSRDDAAGVVKLNQSLCVGCKLCLQVCPFGAISYDFVTRKLVKCQFCDGDPECVKFCETRAIQFVPVCDANAAKRERFGDQLFLAIGKTEEA